ncbi:MAG TPA: FAD-dependent oxidoreductase [Candidatus Angelobacter sp.]|nr:FAD-dependent oxidoreductase [Candidatus Angelobacter sp.]
MKSFSIVILGGGVVAGYAAKEFVVQSGKKGELAIVTAENALPYERPPLSKGFLAGQEKARDIQISDAAFYRKHDIAVFRNFRVRKVDFRRRRLQSTSGQVIGFDQLLVATGSTVRRLKVPGANRSGVFYLRQMTDSQGIREQIKRGRRAVVIGSGFIGMEVASVLASHGVCTTMVFPDDRVWKRLFTPPISTFFERQFADRGITFMKSEKVVALTHKNHECQVVLASGNQVPSDFVVAGIGVTPSMELFRWTPLDTDDGIKVNKFLETSVPGVWAAGDIANYPDQIFHRRMRVEHWDNAVEQGRVAMRNMTGKLQPFIHVPYFFSDFFDLTYEFWGDATGYDQVVYRGNIYEKQFSVWWLKKQTLCAALIMNRPEDERAVASRWILRRPRLDPRAIQNARNLKSLDTTFGRRD